MLHYNKSFSVCFLEQSSVGRRPEVDDMDASSQLPILRDGYYRDVLGEYGAFFSLAYQIDSIHKNAWIAFQSWRASARKVRAYYMLFTADNIMPDDGDSCYIHTFKNLVVLFFRMFIDAMDTKMYDEHHQSASCYLSTSKLLVNVWAYHSARHIVYVDPISGLMEEYHRPKSRRGKMWIQWFSYSTLKSMDEDLAEEADADHPGR
ncbi:hypothetical protein B296_00013536, partial [Ensete ventricosum]